MHPIWKVFSRCFHNLCSWRWLYKTEPFVIVFISRELSIDITDLESRQYSMSTKHRLRGSWNFGWKVSSLDKSQTWSKLMWSWKLSSHWSQLRIAASYEHRMDLNPILKVFLQLFFIVQSWSLCLSVQVQQKVKNQTTTTPVYKTWTCLHIELDIIWKLSSHSYNRMRPKLLWPS